MFHALSDPYWVEAMKLNIFFPEIVGSLSHYITVKSLACCFRPSTAILSGIIIHFAKVIKFICWKMYNFKAHTIIVCISLTPTQS